MENKQLSLISLSLKTIAVHTVTYFIMGILAFFFLNYTERLTRPELACYMRPTDDPLVKYGLFFQPLRGLIFALALYPIRETLFGKKNGWLIMWWLLVALGILSTFAPTLGSVEGMVYTTVPITEQLVFLLEIVSQAFLFSAVLYYWVNHSEKKWLNWVMGVLFFIVILLPLSALLAG